MKRGFAGITGVGLFLFLSVTAPVLGGGDENCAGELRIGFLAPFSGRLESLGASSIEGARLAVEELSDGGVLKVNGTRYNIVILTRDCQDSPEVAVSAAHELINQHDISVIIGPPLSGNAIPVSHIADKAGIPMITQIATHPDLTSGKTHVFRVCYTDSLQGDVMARFAVRTLRAGRAAVLFDIANDYNRTVAAIFRERFTGYGGLVTAYESYTTGTEDFRDHLASIRSSRPDVLFLPNYYQDVLRQVSDMDALGMTVQIIGSDSMSFRDPEQRARIEGAYFSTHFASDVPSEEVSRFASAYREKFDREPTTAGALTYDAMGLLFSVVRDTGSVRAKDISRRLGDLKIYEGVTGVMKFNGLQDPEKSVVIIHVENGKYVYYERIDP